MKQAKKILAIFLSVLMLLSVMSVGISATTADDTIVIDNASDWEAYKQADGSYLLPKDGKFTVTAQMETLSANFNGNGSTITTCVPLFYNVSGVTVENLTLEGNITATAKETAAVLSEYTTNFATIKNVVNNANVSLANFEFGNATEGMGVAGLVGSTSGGTTTIENCINNGTITVHGKNIYASGIVGKIRNGFATIINCVNNGNIISTSDDDNNDGAGGIIGFIYGGKSTVTITGCGNTGTISSKYLAAGIVARNYNRPNAISACYNTGSVSATGTAGIAGGIDATGTNASLNYCWNKGEVTAAVYAAQISAHGASSEMLNNYYLDTFTTKAFAFASVDATNDGATPFTADDLASGKLAYDINTAAGAQLFFQNVNTIEGEQNDAYPVFDSTHGHVFKTGDDTYGSLRFYTLTTASVRISANENERGIRFSTAVNKKDFDALNVEVDFGTLITPNDFLKDAQNDFNALAEGKYLDINSTAEGTDNFKTLKGEDNDTYYYFCGSITGIKPVNYDWDYSAVGYLTINGETVYSTQYATRNIKFIAGEAVKDAASYTEQELEYINTYLQ